MSRIESHQAKANSSPKLTDSELKKIAKRHLDELTMFFRYTAILSIMEKCCNNNHIHLHFLRILQTALTNDRTTRIIRVFDEDSFNIIEVLNQRGELSKTILDKQNINKKEFKDFAKKVLKFRNKYFFHIDKVNANLSFCPTKELWDEFGLTNEYIIHVATNAQSALTQFHNHLFQDCEYKNQTYTGDDFEKIIELINTKDISFFILAHHIY
ncbi:hypothetical protein SAMN04488082_11569 [Desulfomicrobium apsheronum]|uniref:HEPN AbiU2-like domain-containing protein n=1 Tax=Desulfomicrobium apsheronum TaxID=52560 RepID=A0A1I3X899_9BACT|nr:hypothetical protein [Desulfomicrobium apsheronum]SFK15091.1 hypothetical protein SAMN04488082_11569 [Desulfomicrobium apsheronum]